MKKSSQILGEGKYIRLIKTNRWEYVERINISGIVVILAITDDNKILFTEQYRLPVDKNVIELPAGLVGDIAGKEHESLLEAARRELLEETGYEAEHMSVLTEGPPSAGVSAEIITLMLAKNLKKIHGGGGDDTENIITHEVKVHEAPKWLQLKMDQGVPVDPKVYAGLYFANHIYQK